VVRDSSYTENAAAGDPAAGAAAMSSALGRLSQEIASVILASPLPTSST
jgi:hypothetical protein